MSTSSRKHNTEKFLGLGLVETFSAGDLITTAGSKTVTSMTFSQHDIQVNDIMTIDEDGFNANGYAVTSISGQSLDLDTDMPVTVQGGKFTLSRIMLSFDFDKNDQT